MKTGDHTHRQRGDSWAGQAFEDVFHGGFALAIDALYGAC